MIFIRNKVVSVVVLKKVEVFVIFLFVFLNVIFMVGLRFVVLSYFLILVILVVFFFWIIVLVCMRISCLLFWCLIFVIFGVGVWVINCDSGICLFGVVMCSWLSV